MFPHNELGKHVTVSLYVFEKIPCVGLFILFCVVYTCQIDIKWVYFVCVSVCGALFQSTFSMVPFGRAFDLLHEKKEMDEKVLYWFEGDWYYWLHAAQVLHQSQIRGSLELGLSASCFVLVFISTNIYLQLLLAVFELYYIATSLLGLLSYTITIYFFMWSAVLFFIFNQG